MQPDRSPLERFSAYYLRVLADPSLLCDAILVDMGTAVDLAVPVGRLRRSGFMNACTKAEKNRALTCLRAHPELFPKLRADFEKGDDDVDSGWIISWGELVPPFATDRERGELFGYSATAINRFMREHYGISGLLTGK